MDDYVGNWFAAKSHKPEADRQGRPTGRPGNPSGTTLSRNTAKQHFQHSDYTRVIRNEAKGICPLGIPFKQLLTDWQQYYSQIEKRVGESYVAPPDSIKFSLPHHKATTYTTVRSPGWKKSRLCLKITVESLP